MFGDSGVDFERRDFDRRIGRSDRQGTAREKDNDKRGTEEKGRWRQQRPTN
jgi:hypothetical protein